MTGLTLVFRNGLPLVTRNGVYFDFEGDDVLWLWWWKRGASGSTWMSFGADAEFRTLAALRDFWNDYAKAVTR